MSKSLLASHVSSQCSIMRDYLVDMTALMDNNLSDFNDRISQEADNLDMGAKEDWFDSNYDEEWKLTEVFPELYRKSLFVTIYSYLETTMRSFATTLESNRPHEIKIDDLKGTGIQLYKLYFQKVQSIQLKNNRHSQHIELYRKIRNLLVHNNGQMDNTNNSKQIKRFAEKHPSLLEVSPHGEIKIENQTNHAFLDSVESYLCDLSDLLSDT